MPSLFVIQGRDQGKRFELIGPHIALGRDGSNASQLHDTEISRRHVRISRESESDEYTLLDSGSSNGTFVNSQRVQRHVLHSGDRVLIGRTLMIYTGQDESAADNLADGVDIVAGPPSEESSRIIRTMSQEESSQSIGRVDSAESPWLARARSNLQVMYRTALAVSHTLDNDQLRHRIMELIFEWVEADRGCIMLVDPESRQLAPKVLHHRRDFHTGDRMTISQTILDYVMDKQEGVLTSDAREDQRWDAAGSIVKLGVREAIGVPMQGRYGVVGVIYIDTYTPPGRFIQSGMAKRFTEEHLKLMIAIGHQAALAVEDTSYYSAMVQSERLAAIGQTIAGLSHHIKNILQGIRGGSYLIQEGLNNNEPDVVKKGWSIVEKNQERISSLVMDMLTFSKEREPEAEPADLNQVTADVVELMQVRADEAGVELEWNPAPDMPKMTFDPEGLHRAILNVVTNAIDACQGRPDACVKVGTRFHPDSMRLQVVVQDNGLGIDHENLQKIFTVFESGKGTRGTGLGLPVSQKILQEHGGDIYVESRPGEGSCFTLELPAMPPSSGNPCETTANSLHEEAAEPSTGHAQAQ